MGGQNWACKWCYITLENVALLVTQGCINLFQRNKSIKNALLLQHYAGSVNFQLCVGQICIFGHVWTLLVCKADYIVKAEDWMRDGCII